MWSEGQFLIRADPHEISDAVHRSAAEIHLSLPGEFVLSGGIDYYLGQEGHCARIYTFRDKAREGDGRYWGIKPVYITIYAMGLDATTVSIDIKMLSGVLLTVAGYGEDPEYRDSVLDSIEKALERA